MRQQNIVVLIKGDIIETWGSIKEACEKHDWSYSTIVQKTLPVEKDGWKITRVPFRKLHNHQTN